MAERRNKLIGRGLPGKASFKLEDLNANDTVLWNATTYEWDAGPGGGGGSSTLGGLTDVVITGVADNEVLAYDSTSGNWINQTAAEAGLGTATDVAANTTHRTSDGSDHTFLDQSVISGSAPNFVNTNMTGNISVWTNDSGYVTSSHTHAASDITSGTLAHERGGLEANVSGYSGLIKISGGTTSQAVAGTDYLTDVVQDTSPQLGGNLDCQNKTLDVVERIYIDGQTAEYTSTPDPFIYWDQNHTYDYNGNTGHPAFDGVIMPSAVQFSGTHTLGRSASALGLGFLFNAVATVTNESGSAFNFSPFYTLNANIKFVADDAAITQGTSIDIISQPSFSATGASGSLAVTNIEGFRSQGVIGNDASATNRYGYQVLDMTLNGTTTGTLATAAGFCSQLSSSGVTPSTGRYTHVLLGTSTIPTSDSFGIYQATEEPNLFSGTLRLPFNSYSGNPTLDDADFFCTNSSASGRTHNLPTAVGRAGQVYVFKKTNGDITVTPNGSETIDGASTDNLTSTNQYMIIVSDGANWLRIAEGT